MGNPEKMGEAPRSLRGRFSDRYAVDANFENVESGGNLDSSREALVKAVSRMPEGELRDFLEFRTLTPARNIKGLREQVLSVMLKEAKEAPVAEKSADVENVEPEVNDEMEEKLEAEIPTPTLKVVPKDDIVEAPKSETSEEMEERINKVKADLSEKINERERQEEIDRLSPEPPKETSYSSRAELAGGRRIAYRNVDSFPFGRPKRTIEPGNNKGYEKPDLKELKKSDSIVLPERKPLLHKEDLGRTQEVKLPEKDKAIIEAIVDGHDISEKDKKYFDANKERLRTEALRKIGEVKKTNLHEDDKEEDAEKPGVNPDHIFDGAKEPETKQEKSQPVVHETVSTKEPILDGNVAFRMGKMGIIDVSDPKQYEAKKAELVGKIQQEVPGFLNLSFQQQLYVLEKLRQKTKHDLDESVQEELKSTRGIKRFFNGFRAGGVRKELVKQTKEKGFESYKENLKDITTFVQTRGLGVEMTEKGMVLKFVTREGENDKHQEMINEFNRKATVLAEIPYNKTLDDRTPLQILQKKKYEKALKEYEEVRAKLLGYEGKNAGEQVNAKALEFSNIDDDIRMNQALTYSPEATNWVGKQIQKYGLAEKGIVLGTGFAVRGMARYAAGFGGGLVASWVLGGVMGRLRKGKEFQTIANEKRYSDKSDSTEKRAGVKEFIDSKGYAEKINKLVEQIEKTSNPEKREALIQSLNNRIMVAREREESGLVRFGKSKDELKNKFAFIDAIKSAQKIILENDPKFLEESEKVAERLNNIFFKDEKKAIERKEEMKKAFWKGVRNGTIFFTAGFEANDWLMHDGEATKAFGEKIAKFGAEMNAVFAGVGENVRDSISPVSDQNIIGAGKKLVGDFQNEINKAGFFGKSSAVGGNDFVRMNPVSEGFVPSTNEAVAESTSVKLRPDLETLTSEKGSPVNFPGADMPRPDSLPYDINNLPEMPPAPVAEAPVGARGAIGALRDLQRALVAEYGDNIPEKYRHFTDENADRLAIKWGMFRPDQTNESVALPRGSSFVAMDDGAIRLKLPNGQLVSHLNEEDVSFFDSGASVESGASEQVLENQNTSSPGTRVVDRPDLQNTEIPDVQGSEQTMPGRSVYTENGFQGFEDYKDVSVEQGWMHTPSENGGDILSYEYGEPKADEVVEGYSNIDNLKVDSKELKGTIDFLYNSRGEVTGLDLPKLKVPDIDKFRSNPEWFIGGDHSAPERFEMTKKLLTVRSDVEKYLAYRRIMEVQSLHPDSPEFKFLNQESNKLWTAIQKKVDYQFNPNYTGFNANPIENTAPMVGVPNEQVADAVTPTQTPEYEIATQEDLAKEKALEEAHRQAVEGGETPEIIKTTNHTIPPGNEMFSTETISKYGPVERSGNVAFFEKGYVGFYEESGKLNIADAKAKLSADANVHLVQGGDPVSAGGRRVEGMLPVEIVRVVKDGKYQILRIYKVTK